ncbi:MAG: ABC transporter ATP-binding protein, partial [Candidatus Freyarchaeota archaeon]|nr:ABC transporter ATP-binding protein [Candidatus Jordarchaeia archaeon]
TRERRGEFVGLVGPNGSGKTTLLKCLSRLLKPLGGAIFLYGRDIGKMPPLDVARICASVPSEFPADANLAVVDAVMLGRHPHVKGVWWEDELDEEATMRAMERMKVLVFAKRRLGELSSGEKRRVMLAKALAQEAKVLLVDEPVAYLDIRYQLEIMETLRSLADGGVTVIAAMHQLSLAARYCDKLVVLKKGKVVACGRPEEVLCEELIEDVYGVKAFIQKLPEVGLIVTPVATVSSGGSR